MILIVTTYKSKKEKGLGVRVCLAALYGSAALFGNGPISQWSNILFRHLVSTILPRGKKLKKRKEKKSKE